MKLNYYKKMKNTYLSFLSNKNQKEMLTSQNVNKKLFMSGTPKFELYKKIILKFFKKKLI